MRTETIVRNIYKFDELSESAQEKALYDFANEGNYPWNDDNKKALEAFADIFPINVKDWEYGYHNNINFSFTENDDIEELSGVRLATYIYNNYYHSLFKGKYYNKGNWIDGKYINKHRHSKIIMAHSCVLTGVWIDEEILKPIYKFLKNPNPNTTFYDLMNDCLHEWVFACGRDYESYFKEESFKEMCEANDWEFLENGSMA